MEVDPARGPELSVGDWSPEARESNQGLALGRLGRMVLLVECPGFQLNVAKVAPLFSLTDLPLRHCWTRSSMKRRSESRTL